MINSNGRRTAKRTRARQNSYSITSDDEEDEEDSNSSGEDDDRQKEDHLGTLPSAWPSSLTKVVATDQASNSPLNTAFACCHITQNGLNFLVPVSRESEIDCYPTC